MEKQLLEVEYKQQDTSNWELDLDGRYTSVIKNYLISNDFPSEAANKLVYNAAKVLLFCPNKYTKNPFRKTGIIIGKVQSGKTSNFIMVTALAFDNGYDVVEIIGGRTKPLLKQNRERIEEYFQQAKDVKILNTTDHLEYLTADKISQFVRSGKKVIIVTLKSKAKLDYITDNVFNITSNLYKKPVLVFDDEGDEASLNTLISQGKKSSTYKAIENLKNRLECHSFISVTATPQANLLVDALDFLSPDFGVLVEPGEGYCGVDIFHSDRTYTIKIKKETTTLLGKGIPESFINAISMFFVSCAVRYNRGMKPDEKVSMLVHPAVEKINHKAVYEKITALLTEWETKSQDKRDPCYNSLRNILYNAWKKYKDTTIPDIQDFEELEDIILDAIKTCGKHIINGSHVLNHADDFYDYNIYVGGNMLGRGLTLSGLTITYIIRTSKGISSVDTVEQRARWFGYKKKYIDLCRVFADPKILKEFQIIRQHEKDLWETVEKFNLQGKNFKEMSRIFTLSDGMTMTRSSVAKTSRFIFYKWNKQTLMQTIQEYTDNNLNILNLYRKKHDKEKIIKNYGKGNPYVVFENMDFIEVKNEIIDNYIFPQNEDGITKSLIDKLETLLQKKNLHPKIDVIWMRDGVTSKHPIDSDNYIGNYSVGRRPLDKSLPVIYKGDDYQFVTEDKFQLQIHIIENKNDPMQQSPALAFYIPVNVISKLTNLVTRG